MAPRQKIQGLARIPYFANTSGTTTGVTKHIPVSAEMVKANRRAVLDLLKHHIANRPHSHILAGKNFMLGGSTDLTPCAPGVAMGDLSGIAVNEVPWREAGTFHRENWL